MTRWYAGSASDPEYLASRIAALLLPEEAGEGRPVVAPERMWPRLFRRISRQRLTGLAVAGVRAGLLPLHPDHRDQLFERHRDAMLLVISLERRLCEVVAALEGAGVEAVALKGATIAHTFYPNASLRTYGDIDLLIGGDDWTVACSILGDLGFRRILPEPRPGFDVRFGKGAAFRDRDGVEVDLHRTLALGAFGLWIEPAELLEATDEMRLGGRTVRRLDDTHSLLHVCLHAALGRERPLLLPLRDVVQVAWRGRIDWDRLQSLTDRWRLRAPIAHAFTTAADVLAARIPAPAAALALARSRRLERRLLKAYTTERAARGGVALSSLWGIPGWRAKAAYVGALLLPDRRFLDARSGGHRGSYRARWRAPIRWVARPRRLYGQRRVPRG